MSFEYGTDEWESEYQAVVAERMKNPPPYMYFSPEWAALWEKAIREDEQYRQSAATWEGSVVLHVEQAPEYGLDIDLFLFMDLWHGDCRSLRFVPQEAGEAGDFMISGSLERWMQIGKKELDTTKAMMQGKLKLKGDLPTIVRAIRPTQRLTELSVEVGGIFPTDFTDKEISEIRALCAELSEKFLG